MRYGAVDITGRHNRTSVPPKDQCSSQRNRFTTVDAAVDYVVCVKLCEVAWAVLNSVDIFG